MAVLSPSTPMILQNAATSGNGGTLPIQGTCSEFTLSIQGTGTITAGAISIEEAYYPNNEPQYSGTWSVITSVPYTSFNANNQVIVHVVGSFWNIRARISTPIAGGGTVTVATWGNA